MSKMKLSYCDQSNHMCVVMETRQDNNIIDCIGLVYNENDPELLGPICLSTISKKKTKQDKDITNCISVVYIETKIELLGPIWLGAVCDKNQTTQQRDWLYMCRLWWKWNWTIKLIKLGVIYYENQKGQWHERSYMYGLHRKRHRVVVIDQTGCSLWWKPDKIRTWLIIQVWSCWKQNWILGTYLTRCNLWRKPNNTITWPIV